MAPTTTGTSDAGSATDPGGDGTDQTGTGELVHQDGTTGQGTPPDLGDAGKAAIAEERKARRAADKRAADLEKQIEELQRQQMTEQERAIAEARDAAKAEGAQETLGKVGARLVAAEFKMQAAGRLEGAQLDTLLGGLNLTQFLDAEGEVDTKAVGAFIDGVAGPAGSADTSSNGQGDYQPVFPDLGQGKRSQSTGAAVALNDDPMLKAIVSKVGTRNR